MGRRDEQLDLLGGAARPRRVVSRWPGGALFAPHDVEPIAPYRLWLWRLRPRVVSESDPRSRVVFIGLNPSTADAEVDDATIRKCIGFAMRWGFDAVDMVNLWPLRSTKPDVLLTAAAPEFVEFAPVRFKRSMTDGDRIVREVFRRAHRIVAAWGSHEMVKRHPERVREVLGLVPAGVEVAALKLSKDGHPWHPLYVPYETTPITFWPGGLG